MSANVNKPTDVKTRDTDIARKLQIYGIISAFQAGKVPSNDQIDVALNSFLESRVFSHPSSKLSDEGKVLVADAKEVVKQAKYLLLSKNDGNLLQDFIWQTQTWDPKSVKGPNAPVDKETARQHGNQALENMRTLGTLIITNGQFRKLIKDAGILLRDIAGDAATSAADRVRPSEDERVQMDRPADDNTWHDKPNFSKDNLKQQMQSKYGGKPKDDVKQAARAGEETSKPADTNDPRQADPQAGKNAAKNTLQRKADEKLSDEDKERIRARNEEYRRRAKEYFNKKMPQERKDQTIWRLKKMVLECQQHPDYARAVQTLLDLAEQYGRHGRDTAKQGSGTAKQARSGLGQAEKDLKTLIERFANGTSTDPLWSAIGQIYTDADKDPELKDWFKSMDSYIRRCLLEQGYILEEDSSREWDRLYDHGRYLLREKYRRHTDNVVDELRFIAEQFDQDVQNRAFSQSLQKLFTDLGHNENGTPVFKPHLLKDVRDVILPAAFENIAYIPVPRIEYQDPQVDLVIENLVLESDNFAPNVFEIWSQHYFKWGRKMAAGNKSQQQVEATVKGVQMDLRDVSYHIKRKQGFPSITDTGVANIQLGGDGLSFKVKMSSADAKDKNNFFKVDKVDVDVKNLSIKLVKSNYKMLFALFKPMMLKVLRPALQKVAEKSIKDKVHQLDTLMYQIKQEADRAKEDVRRDPNQAPNVYNRYYKAAQKRIVEGKKKTKEVASDKKLNMAMTKEDSIFPDIHLPGGTSSKATEYKEQARKGDKWESPVFSIGSAKKSNDIPTTPRIEKKTRPNYQNGGAQGGVNTLANGGYQTQNGGHQNGGHQNGGYQNGGLNGNGYQKHQQSAATNGQTTQPSY